VGTEIGNHPQPYRPPLFRSVNRGQTWEDVTGTVSWHVLSFAYDELGKQILAVTEVAQLYKSGDQGRTWTGTSQPPTLDLLRDPRNPSYLWGSRQAVPAMPVRDSVMFSPNMGDTWYPAGIPDRNTRITFNKSGSRLFAASFPAGMYTAAIPPVPRLTFDSLASVDGGVATFVCPQVKMFNKVTLTVNGQVWPLQQTVFQIGFPFRSVTCGVAVPPGTAPGDYAARLELDGFTLPFTLKVTRGTNAIANAMTTVLFTTPDAYAPGDIVSVFGVRLSRPSAGVGAANVASTPFPVALNQTRAIVIGPGNATFPAPVQLAFTDAATGASQVNIQLPTSLAAGPYGLRMERLTEAGQVDSVAGILNFTVAAYQPLFLGNATYPVFLQNITQDPLGSVFATTARPARPGDVLTLYATGMGVTTPRLGAGTVPAVLTRIAAQPRNSLLSAGGLVEAIDPIGGIVASPQFPGLYQMSIQLPLNLDTSQAVVLRHELGAVRVNVTIPVAR
jgi:uncharacterized protein (TIGR03437 family)